MVNYRAERLSRLFGALADPTRRAILARLSDQGGLSVSELAAPFAIKLPAIMKHLDILDRTGLIRRSKTGRTVTVSLEAGSLRPAIGWLQQHQRFWSASLDRLVDYAEAKERKMRRS